MKKFLNIDPLTVNADHRIFFRFNIFTSDKNDHDYIYLLMDHDYLIFVAQSVYIDENSKELVGGTLLEIPKEGLSWFIKVIEEKFFKTEDQGGLPKGKYGFEGVIREEKLVVSRMFGEPGYSFRNHSRHSHLFEDSTDPQDLPLSDELLFKKGLFTELKKIAIKIENGDL